MEVCPTSNVRLGRVPSYSTHPLRAFWQHHIPLSINTDDPRLFGSDLTQEYLKAMQHSGFTLTDLQQTILHSLDAAFLPPEKKHLLHEQITQEWQQVICQHDEVSPNDKEHTSWKGTEVGEC